MPWWTRHPGGRDRDGGDRAGARPALRRAAADVRGQLPVRAGVDRVRLIAGTMGTRSWRTVAEFALADA
ncbi:hypothetical protein [Amycolatopsis vastitatis]|uniref:hypothetical protein n=1 Tax=Amycolatopsis vastitatis TaxID=1905142 RepID=UPI00196BA8BC|nr:hypothetical protein [Amycolatopsis vastitatis]